MANWQIKRKEKIVGTVNTKKLKQLAASGKLKESDLLQKEGNDNWVVAGKIKGLFESQPLKNQKPNAPSKLPLNTNGNLATQVSQSEPKPIKSPSGIRSKLGIGIALLGCGGLLSCLALFVIAVILFGSGNNENLAGGKDLAGNSPSLVGGKEVAAFSDLLPNELRSKAAKPLSLQPMLKELKATQGFSTKLGFSPKGSYTYSLSKQSDAQGKESQTLRLWNTKTGAEISISNEEIDYFSLPAVFSPSEESIACLDGDFIRIWKLGEGSAKLHCSERLQIEIGDDLSPHVQWLQNESIVVSTRLDPNKSREYVAISSFDDGTPNQENFNCFGRGLKIKRMHEHERQQPKAVVSPNCKTLAFKLRHKIVVQDVETSRIVKELEVASGGDEFDFGYELRIAGLQEENFDPAPSMSFTTDGNQFMSFVPDRQRKATDLVVWDSDTWTKQGSINCGQFQKILCFSNDQKLFAALVISESRTSRGVTRENEVLVFSTENTKLVSRISLGEEFEFSNWCLEKPERRFATFSPDNSSLTIALSSKGKWNSDWRNGFTSGREENVWAVGSWNVKEASRRWVFAKRGATASRFAINPSTEYLAYFNGVHEIVDAKSISNLFESLASGESAWGKKQIDVAFEHYSVVASHPEKQFYTEELPKVFARCIDYYGDQSDSLNGRKVFDYMIGQGMQIDPETDAGKELVRLYQEEKAKAQAKLIAEKTKIERERLDLLRQENRARYVEAKFLTKNGFIDKLRNTLSGGRINANSAQAVFHDFAFQDVFGSPDSNVAWNDARLIQYNCSDGAVQMVATYNGGYVWITEVNLY